MGQDIPEADWRLISRELKPLALDRYYKRVLADAAAIIAADRPSRDRYGDLYSLMKDRDKEIATHFDRFSRSTAKMVLLSMWSMGLLQRSELDGLTEETREWLFKLLPGEA